MTNEERAKLVEAMWKAFDTEIGGVGFASSEPMKAALAVAEQCIRDDPMKFIEVKELEWDDCGYAPYEMGPHTHYYQIEKVDDALDIWTVEYGVICHEFGGTEIHKCIGEPESKAAATAHHRAQIAQSLGVKT